MGVPIPNARKAFLKETRTPRLLLCRGRRNVVRNRYETSRIRCVVAFFRIDREARSQSLRAECTLLLSTFSALELAAVAPECEGVVEKDVGQMVQTAVVGKRTRKLKKFKYLLAPIP